jgi:hypothetical protein
MVLGRELRGGVVIERLWERAVWIAAFAAATVVADGRHVQGVPDEYADWAVHKYRERVAGLFGARDERPRCSDGPSARSSDGEIPF